ncbi:hypothetical protein OG607_17015 [Streptomyces sp. NBC_01537]|uniref:hypothetical protein n=1 Tax=Streptomyces sp. NBC_01537 TaxID=2903896 RepID=UPI00386A53F9
MVASAALLTNLNTAGPAYAACTSAVIDSVGTGCGSTATASPSPTDTDIKPTVAATVSSGPTVSAAPSSSGVAAVSGPPTVTGVFTLGSGAPLSGATVTLTAVDSVPDDGTSVTPTVVGTTTTGPTGTWSYTLPATLSSDLQALADSNGGVLALQATYDGTAPDGTLMTGSDFVDAGVATGAATTEGSAQARTETADTVAIHPDVDTTTVTLPDAPDTDAGTGTTDIAGDSATPAWQNADGTSDSNFKPDVVNGVDYSTVTPSIGVPSCSTASKVIKSGIYYTTVGEGHAYYDTTASFDYSDSLSSTWGVATSVDGQNWSITGKISRKSSMGHSTGFSGQGPKWARQWRVPIRYHEVDVSLYCPGAKTKHHYNIQPVKYEVPAGGAVGKYGADVSSKDGAAAYSNSRPAYRGVIPKKSYYTVTEGNSVTWSVAVKAFNVAINLDTEYGSSHYQRISAGSGSLEHDIWGAKGPVSGKPGVIYSF